MPAGYGSLHGQVMNPYDMRTNPNGSSGGAVAAAAAGLAAATVGVETDAATTGTRQPDQQRVDLGARRRGGDRRRSRMRPTFGLVSRTGILPAARSQETAAPVGRTVADVAASCRLVGRDAADAATATRRRSRPTTRRAQQERARRASGSA